MQVPTPGIHVGTAAPPSSFQNASLRHSIQPYARIEADALGPAMIWLSDQRPLQADSTSLLFAQAAPHHDCLGQMCHGVLLAGCHCMGYRARQRSLGALRKVVSLGSRLKSAARAMQTVIPNLKTNLGSFLALVAPKPLPTKQWSVLVACLEGAARRGKPAYSCPTMKHKNVNMSIGIESRTPDRPRSFAAVVTGSSGTRCTAKQRRTIWVALCLPSPCRLLS